MPWVDFFLLLDTGISDLQFVLIGTKTITKDSSAQGCFALARVALGRGSSAGQMLLQVPGWVGWPGY